MGPEDFSGIRPEQNENKAVTIEDAVKTLRDELLKLPEDALTKIEENKKRRLEKVQGKITPFDDLTATTEALNCYFCGKLEKEKYQEQKQAILDDQKSTEVDNFTR